MIVPREAARLERVLAAFLGIGTWISCATVATGMVLQMLPVGVWGRPMPAAGAIVVTSGVALLILLPPLRVLLMLCVFFRSGDRRYVLISAVVLLVIAAGFLLGLHRVP